MFEIGSSLRQAREHRRLDMADAESATHIRAKYLAALEDERFEVLPGAAYVRGFLRTYAEFLGLDGSLLVEEYNERFAPPDDDLVPLQPAGLQLPSRPVVPRALAVVAAAAVFGGVAVWQLGFTSAERTPITKAKAAAPRPHPAKPRVAKPHRAAPKPAIFVLRATRGDCWVLVRVGSPTGRVVFESTVTRGHTVRFGLKRPLFVRLGAPWNTDVTVRGKPLPPFPPAETVNLRAA